MCIRDSSNILHSDAFDFFFSLLCRCCCLSPRNPWSFVSVSKSCPILYYVLCDPHLCHFLHYPLYKMVEILVSVCENPFCEFAVVRSHFMRTKNPVSYTHLDVYKRQPVTSCIVSHNSVFYIIIVINIISYYFSLIAR